MRKCYISKNYKDLNGAGNKAKVDIEASLKALGFINLGLKQSHKTHLVANYIITLSSILKAILSVKKGDIVLIQYPWKKYFDFL